MKSKKFLCVLMALLMLTAACVCPAYAAGNAAAEPAVSASAVTASAPVKSDLPLVVVRGMMFMGLTYTDDSGNTGNCVDFSAKDIPGVLGSALWAAIKNFSFSAGMKVIFDYVGKAFGHLACDTSGNSVYDVSANPYEGKASSYSQFTDAASKTADHENGLVANAISYYGEDKVYFYVYDWRLDPYDVCDGINEMIETAKRDNNCDKVNLICGSMGGIMTLNYLDKYGSSSLNSIVMDCSTAYGTYVVGDGYTGKLALNGEGVYNYLAYRASSNTALSSLVNFAHKIGLTDKLADAGNKLVARYHDQIDDTLLRNIFATMPATWALVQPDKYEEAKQYIFGADSAKYAGLIARTDRSYAINCRRQEILDAAAQSGTHISFVSCYNIALAPVYEHSATQGDGDLEVHFTSGGARTADIGSPLTDEQLAGVAAEYISPDRDIDASTCAFPQSTWFVKNCWHVGGKNGSDFNKLLFFLCDSKQQPTVNDNALYPRYLSADSSMNFIY